MKTLCEIHNSVAGQGLDYNNYQATHTLTSTKHNKTFYICSCCAIKLLKVKGLRIEQFA